MNHQLPPVSAGANTTASISSSSQTTSQTSFPDVNTGGSDEGTQETASGGGGGAAEVNVEIGRMGKDLVTPKMSSRTLPPRTVFNFYKNASNNLEYFTNNHFSRSFNSLILDDLKQEHSGATGGKKTLNKSPPFNVKQDYYMDTDRIDSYLDDDFVNEVGEDEDDDFDDFSDGNDNNDDDNDNDDDGDDDDDDELDTIPLQSPTLKAVEPIRLFDKKSSPGDPERLKRSSLKRSSKFLNLSLESPNSTLQLQTKSSMVAKNKDPIDCSSDVLNNSPSPIAEFRSPSVKTYSTSSPVASKTPFNKFKRPHQLVSQSPSPNSQKAPTSKHLLYHQYNYESNSTSATASAPMSPETSTTSQLVSRLRTDSIPSIMSINVEKQPPSTMSSQRNLSYSPSKLGLTGFKMFKNANRTAIISPNRSANHSENEGTKTGSTITADRLGNVFDIERPKTSAGIFHEKNASSIQPSKPSMRPKSQLSIANKLRKTTNIRSPFTSEEQKLPLSPPQAFEYYNLDNMDLMDLDGNSPSYNKKAPNVPFSGTSNISTGAVSIYEDNDRDQKNILLNLKRTNIPNDDKTINNKENEPVPGLRKNSSYKFVKPLQAAFKSTGLVKKNSVHSSMDPNERKLPPETPTKKHPTLLAEKDLNTPISQNYSKLLQTSSLGKIPAVTKPNSHSDDNLELSIEFARNNASHLSNEDHNTSYFKISPLGNASSEGNLNVLPNESDVDMILDDLVPETPTKSVKKSHSIPANFSPVSSVQRKVILTNSIEKRSLSNLRKSQLMHNEPSTPTGMYPTDDHSKELTSSFSTRDSFGSSQNTLCNDVSKQTKLDDHLVHKFGMKNIKYLGYGEFSIAYECSFQDQKFAIKKTKKPVLGKLERKAINREIDALRVLTSVKDNEQVNLQEQEEGKENLVYFIEAWEFNNYYYIMTENCEGGSLSAFLEDNKNYKIDEFRIWKILIEILNGLKFIHLKNYLHLDLKPANIFITFEGCLKIGDFGLATKLPILEKDFDLEGDRNYIAPELINDKIYSPFADIFSVGLIILEIAANIILPENGSPWRKLRSGDLSDAGKLSSDNISDFLQHQNFSSLTSYNSSHSNSSLLQASDHQHRHHNKDTLPGIDLKCLIPKGAPKFLIACDSNNLDQLVSKMLMPNPFDRPNAKLILEMEECVIIENRRKAGATIFEGEFGPSDDE